MAQDQHETIMQSIISLGIAARYIAKASPKQFKHCIDAAIRADEVINQFRKMSKWKKEEFNRLFEKEEKDYEMICAECFKKFDMRACPYCNHINEP